MQFNRDWADKDPDGSCPDQCAMHLRGPGVVAEYIPHHYWPCGAAVGKGYEPELDGNHFVAIFPSHSWCFLNTSAYSKNWRQNNTKKVWKIFSTVKFSDGWDVGIKYCNNVMSPTLINVHPVHFFSLYHYHSIFHFSKNFRYSFSGRKIRPWPDSGRHRWPISNALLGAMEKCIKMMKVRYVIIITLIVYFSAVLLTLPLFVTREVKQRSLYISLLERDRRFRIFQNNMKTAFLLQATEQGSGVYGPSVFSDLDRRPVFYQSNCRICPLRLAMRTALFQVRDFGLYRFFLFFISSHGISATFHGVSTATGKSSVETCARASDIARHSGCFRLENQERRHSRQRPGQWCEKSILYSNLHSTTKSP